MSNPSITPRFLLVLLVIGFTGLIILERNGAAAQEATLPQLEAKLQKQYAAIEDLFAHGPAKQVYPPDFRERLRRWQDDLAHSFADAGATIDEILKLHTPDEEKWRERSDTMWPYSQPISPPA